MEVNRDYNKNFQAVRNSESPDISINRLSKELNKEVDNGYIDKPTNEKFVVTQENKRGKASFPMLLITDTLGTNTFKDTIKDMLLNVPKAGKKITVSYVFENSVIYLCHTYANNKTLKALDNFCVQYKYVVSKGVVEENPNFEDDIDYEYFRPRIIIDDGNLVDFKPEEEEEEIVATKDMKELQKEINMIIDSGNNLLDNNALINNLTPQPKEEPTAIEIPIITKQEPTKPPTVEPEVESKVKAW